MAESTRRGVRARHLCWIGLLLVVVTAALGSMPGRTWATVQRNLFLITYTNSFLGQLPLTPDAARRALPEESDANSLHQAQLACYTENFARVFVAAPPTAGDAEFGPVTDPECPIIVAVGHGPVTLPVQHYTSNHPLFARGRDQLEFRRNSAIWGPIYVRENGVYDIVVQGRAMGCPPAMLELTVDAVTHVLPFGEESEEQIARFDLTSGLRWVTLAFVNDGQCNGRDRNFRLAALSVTPHQEQ